MTLLDADGQSVKEKANKIREEMMRGAIDSALQEIQKIPDSELIGAVSRKIHIKFKIF